MKNKGFKKKRFKYRRRSVIPASAGNQKNSLSAVYKVLISCATDKGPKRTNQDYYGFRAGSEIITFDQERLSCVKEYDAVKDLLAAVADGVSMAYHPDNPEEDAQAIAVKHLLTNMYYQFNMNGQENQIADELNELVLEQAEKYHGPLATTISLVGMTDGKIKVMYLGDSPVLHVHNGVLEMITPPKQTNFLECYLGNTFASGRKMAVYQSYPITPGDTWIIASDGALEALTFSDGSIDSKTILEIINGHKDNPALELVEISGSRIIPGEERKCADNRTAVVIQIEEGV